MEHNIEKKEQTVSALKEKLKCQHEKYQLTLKAVEHVKTRISLLEEQIHIHNNNLNETNNTEVSLKDSTASLAEANNERKILIQEESVRHTEVELHFEKEVPRISIGIATSYNKYDQQLVEEELRKSLDENKQKEAELADLKALVQQKLKNYSERKQHHLSDETTKTLNEMVTLKKAELDKISEKNKKFEEEIAALQLEQENLQNDESDLKEKLAKLDNDSPEDRS